MGPPESEMGEVQELVGRIQQLKVMNVVAASVVISWLQRRIQPLQKRDRLGFEYLGDKDPSHLSSEPLAGGDALKTVQRVLLDVTSIPYVPKLFCANNPPKQVKISCYQGLFRVLI